ncbi:MAG: hypothetical protein H7222_03715 [Methylotenera sp.]|nr:hypothetical protein [Oligoflexia bacterium]
MKKISGKWMGSWAGMVLVAVGAINLGAAPAHAQYYRFWRGVQRPDLTSSQFEKGLNEKLLPATGDLFRTSVGIKSYQPVLFGKALTQLGHFPSEVALLTYKSEEAYQAYRATAPGQAYGDLHFEIFQKDGSGSLVPELYRGTVKLEAAYDLVGRDVDWNQGISQFKVYSRSGRFSDAKYLSSIRDHIEHVTEFSPKAAVLLIAKDYVLEYTLWSSRRSLDLANQTIVDTEILDDLVEITSRTDLSIELHLGSSVREGQGVRYHQAGARH